MPFRSFFILFAISTVLSSPVHGKAKEERQPVGDRAAPVQILQPDATDARQTVGTREITSKSKKNKKNKDRQEVGVRASSEPIQQPIVTDIRQPIGSREMPTVQYKAPIRIERPIQLPTATVQVPQRPVIRARSLPPVILIDRRSESYGSATLTPNLISRKGDYIQLDDGSNWRVRHKDQKRVKNWKQEDLIVIETGQLFTWSIYKLVNYSRAESSDVELIQPTRNGLLSHWITEIHPFDGYLRLQDGSVWRMDTSELLNWHINDDVIIGLSKDLFSSHYSYILINPRAKTRLLATFNLSF
ncbi:MAG: hypothetical protein H0T62_09525 [Parachlamydiaceae bacterium]|nr:hypothetical protein [Parachlamydiaceae bacterium]